MESSRLSTFRERLYRCFTRSRDALMNACDALLSETSARSFAELSLSPYFPRRWPSLYEAFQDGGLDRAELRKLLASEAPSPPTGKRLLLGIDASGIARPASPTLKDRSSQYVHNLPECKAPVTAGWQFSALVGLPETPSSWTYPLDNQRIPTDQTPAEVAARQLRQIVPLLSAPPLNVGDRGYGSAAFVKATDGIACDLLLRLSSDRVFYRAAPPQTGKRGAPKKDGERFKCSVPSTHGPSDASWEGRDEKDRRVEVSRWDGLHFRQFREQTVSVIRVIRQGAKGTKRDPKESWFVWVKRTNAPDPLLSDVPSTYALRFSQEHGYRFDKGSLLWEKPRLRTPEAFQLWTDLVTVAHAQLVLARPFVDAQRQPWESGKRLATPQQVRRAMGRFLVELGTPASLPQPRGKSPGRPAGVCIRLAPRFPVVKKLNKSKPGEGLYPLP
jgi:hypothetical protein